MVKSDSGYIYIGKLFHRHGKDLSSISEKKIGKSIDVPNRETALNSTKYTIGYTMIKYWAVNEMSNVEKSIHALLPNRLTGEWFEDEDDSLTERLTRFMNIIGGVEQNVDVSGLDITEKKIIKSAKDRTRINELAGQQFSYATEGVLATLEIAADGRFLCVETGTIHDTPNGPFREVWKGKITGTGAINAWNAPKNKNGNTIDKELSLLN